MAKQNAFGHIQHAPEVPKMANANLRKRTGDRRADALQDICKARKQDGRENS